MGFDERTKAQWARLRSRYPVIAWSMIAGGALGAVAGLFVLNPLQASLWWKEIFLFDCGLGGVLGAVAGLILGTVLQVIVFGVRFVFRVRPW